MDEELKKRMVSYLDVLESAAKAGGEFAADKVPETIQQWITYTIVESVVTSALLSVSTCVCGYLAYRIFKWAKENPDCIGPHPAGMLGIFPLSGSVISFVSVFSPVSIALKAWLAPNVFILESVATLVKK